MQRQVRGIQSQDCFRPKFSSTLTLGGTGLGEETLLESMKQIPHWKTFALFLN